MAILEPKISGDRALAIIRKLLFSHSFVVNAIGFVGGIWILWNEADIQVFIISQSRQVVHTSLAWDGAPQCCISFVYGAPRRYDRFPLWDDLIDISSMISLPWLVLGDFNKTTTANNRQGGVDLSIPQAEDFRPKAQGGLSLTKAKEMNDAFLMKLVWRIPTEPEALWVRILLAKYTNVGRHGTIPIRLGTSSPLWRGIQRVWSVVQRRIQINIHSGQDTSFWYDLWLDNGMRLIDVVSEDSIQPFAHFTVRDITTNEGEWNWNLLTSVLPPAAQALVGGMPTPYGSEDDSMLWGPDPKGFFTLKSAYNVLANISLDNNQYIWRHL
ncbi:Putative ribonuclease H protein At1g65750 [Linum grandiflorum]